jgi:hypothetical protein
MALSTLIPTLILLVLAAYAGVGGVFALWFCLDLGGRGVSRLDHAARGSGVLFRAMIFPGVVALWPLMLMKWLKAPRAAAVAEPHA